MYLCNELLLIKLLYKEKAHCITEPYLKSTPVKNIESENEKEKYESKTLFFLSFYFNIYIAVPVLRTGSVRVLRSPN